MNLALVESSYCTRSAGGQASSAAAVSAEDIENAVRFISSVMGYEARGQSFYSYLVLLHLRKPRWQTKVLEDVEADPKETKERLLHVFEMKEPALISTKKFWGEHPWSSP